tara:strand:+ start:338 stop:442 length:105 start_codon:yes stop_codon:yes gene_type:complete
MRIIAPILALTLCMGCDKDEDDTAVDTAVEDTAE